MKSVCPHEWWEKQESRIEIVSGNICAEHLGLDEALYTSLAARVTHIIHSAAMVKFSAPIEKARAINVEGTKPS